MKSIYIVAIACLITMCTSQVAHSNDIQPEVELAHWWISPGEKAALNVIKQEVEKRGAKFSEIQFESWDALRTSSIKRLKLGYPPAITQWLSGKKLIELSELQAIAAIPDLWRDQKVSDVLYEEVFRDNQHKGKLVDIPLGIHIQNTALYNAKIYQELDLELPKTWQEFLDQAVLIKKAGYIPIALSNENWQLNQLFNTILLEKLTRENFRLFYLDAELIKQWEKQLTEAFAVFIKLKDLSDPEQKNRSWNNTVRMIGEGKAAMHVLGDFSKSELKEMGLKAGEDFYCSLAPGSEDNLIYAIDNFIVLNVGEDYLVKGQELLFDIALDPIVQSDYNHKKGSIPVRKDVDISQFDSCSQQTVKQWLKHRKNSISLSEMNNPVRKAFVREALDKAWNESIPPETLSRWLIERFDQ